MAAPQAATNALTDALHNRTATVYALQARVWTRRADITAGPDAIDGARTAVFTVTDAINGQRGALIMRHGAIITRQDAVSTRAPTAGALSGTLFALTAKDYPHQDDVSDL